MIKTSELIEAQTVAGGRSCLVASQVHVAKDTTARSRSDALFEPYVAPITNSMLKISHEVLVSSDALPVVVEEFCDKVKAHLVVMGSEATAAGGKARRGVHSCWMRWRFSCVCQLPACCWLALHPSSPEAPSANPPL